MKKTFLSVLIAVVFYFSTFNVFACWVEWQGSKYCATCIKSISSQHCKLWKCPLTANVNNLMAGCALHAECTIANIGKNSYQSCGGG